MSLANRVVKGRQGGPEIGISDLFSLGKRTILITGGGGAVGLQVAKSILETGGDVICLDRAIEPIRDEWQKALSTAQSTNSEISYHQCDITDYETVAEIFETAVPQARYPLRGLITCHGLSAGGSSLEFSIGKVKQLVDVNFVSTFFCAQAAAKEFQRNDHSGSIVLVASMSAHVCNKGVETAAYNSSKAAVVQLARSLAAEWGSRTNCPLIRVNTISPGYIRTQQTAETLLDPEMEKQWTQDNMLFRLSYADEYRGAAMFLLSDASSFVTGADIRVDGGHTSW